MKKGNMRDLRRLSWTGICTCTFYLKCTKLSKANYQCDRGVSAASDWGPNEQSLNNLISQKTCNATSPTSNI
jgi:hypothetical protein